MSRLLLVPLPAILALLTWAAVTSAGGSPSITAESYQDDRGATIEYQGFYQHGQIAAVGQVSRDGQPSHCLGGWCSVASLYTLTGMPLHKVQRELPIDPLTKDISRLADLAGNQRAWASQAIQKALASGDPLDVIAAKNALQSLKTTQNIVEGMVGLLKSKLGSAVIEGLEKIGRALLPIPEEETWRQVIEDSKRNWVSPLTPEQLEKVRRDTAAIDAWASGVRPGLIAGIGPAGPGAEIGYTPSLGGNGGWDRTGTVIVGPIICLSGC